ncbi:hypothetical protein GWO43_28025 [candidate division KSB1 bacterium]|nr:hypothetical protein [candidate division KSB1 bacterium]NIV69436.1 hypothetical protein [Phycisphaerae bacterium]NIR70734.1 hypothetical protein [candidate division KSB1 bacterium]NIS27791.1 hypothetical protein [candidate division KSB1 bacterium]NIT74639.1 hypothetical protein [candidate division KSB1 bacterium]
MKKNPAGRIASAGDVIQSLTEKQARVSSYDDVKSIAVLYFENMSSDKENEYFCAGITEDIIIDLSKIQDLKVIPRSDVLPFRNQEINSRRIGETLGVHHILEGSVRKAGKRLRITAQLIDVHSGFQVWAERYDRSLEDVFEIQMEVAEKISEAMKVSLSETEKKCWLKNRRKICLHMISICVPGISSPAAEKRTTNQLSRCSNSPLTSTLISVWLIFTSDIQKEYDAGIKYYKLASAVKPYSEEPWMHLEMMYRRKGDLEASREARDKMLELAERNLK